MAFVRPLIDYNGNLQEVAVGDYIQPAILGAGTPSSNTILDGSGNWVTIASLNYWTKTGSDVYYNSGNVYIGHSSSLGSYKLQVTGNSVFEGNVNINGTGSNAAFGVYLGGTTLLELNNTQVYTEKQIYSLPLDGTPTLLKTINGIITRATSAEIADFLGAASNDYIQNQSASFQSGNFRITGTGIGYGFYAAPNTLSGVGYSSLMPGNSTQAGYIEIVSSNKGRLGYIGYDNNNLTYLSEGAANHVFLGNKTLIGSGAVYGSQVFQVTGTSYFSSNIAIAGNIDLIVGANRYIQIGSSTNYYYNLQSVNDDFQILEAGTIARITIKYPNGFVGIGTTTPNANLEVSHHIRINSGSNQYGYQLTNDNEGTHFRLRYFANNVVYSNLITGVYTGIIILGNDPSQNGTKTLQVNGGIRQNDVISGLVYADSIGQFASASQSHVMSILGDSAYIKNQSDNIQTGSFRISGIGRLPTILLDQSASSSYAELQFRKAGIIQFDLFNYTDAGSNLMLARYGDAGEYLGMVFHVNRGNGNFGFYNNVGIGTINPAYGKLHIIADSAYNWESSAGIAINSADASGASELLLGTDGTNSFAYIQAVQRGVTYNHKLVINANGGAVVIGGSGSYLGYSVFQVNGSINQTFVTSNLVYANSAGVLIAASAQNVRDLLGTGSYIQNQFDTYQSANYWISGYARIGQFVPPVAAHQNKLVVSGQHIDTTMCLYSQNNVTNTSLDMWASEHGLTYDGVGIGLNVNNNPNYGRRNTSIGQAYIRFHAGNIFVVATTTEQTNPTNAVWKFGSDGVFYWGQNRGLLTWDSGYAMLASTTGNKLHLGVAGVDLTLMTLTTNSKVLIGTISETGTWKLQVNSGSSSDNGLYVNGNIRATGTIVADGYFSGTSSDRIYKSDFKKVSVYSVIDNISVYSYNHKLYDNKRLIGSVAQEIEKYFPELITTDANGYLRVDNYGYAALALQLGKETKTEVERLKERVKELETRLGI